jgi:hypothetical protein
MIWNSRVQVTGWIVPDFMASSGVAIKSKAKELETLYYFTITETG